MDREKNGCKQKVSIDKAGLLPTLQPNIAHLYTKYEQPKSDVLVPILLIGVKFAKCEICGSTKLVQLLITDRHMAT
ncbi:MAG: hypothetical protein AB2693_16070 [Candidatus Thiodiazotropha sp.]